MLKREVGRVGAGVGLTFVIEDGAGTLAAYRVPHPSIYVRRNKTCSSGNKSENKCGKSWRCVTETQKPRFATGLEGVDLHQSRWRTLI